MTAEEIEWDKIQDKLLGTNFQECNVQRALTLALHCTHPTAKFLMNLVGYQTELDSRQFIDILSRHIDNGLVQYWLSRQFYWLGHCLSRQGQKEQAAPFLKRASKLGCVEAMIEYAGHFPARTSVDYWKWLVRSAEKGCTTELKDALQDICELNDAKIQMYLAKVFKDNFKHGFLFFYRVGVRSLQIILQCEYFYILQLEACKAAVDAWTCVAIRLKLYKDVRRLISNWIWDARYEGAYCEK